MNLYVFDLDDTLFPSNTYIDQKTIDLLNKLLQKGDYLAINSGRPLFGIKNYIKDLKINDHFFITSFNGSVTYDYLDNPLYILHLEFEDFLYFHDLFINDKDIYVYAWTLDNYLIGENIINQYTKHELKFNNAKGIIDYNDYISDKVIIKIVIAGSEQALNNININDKKKMYLIQRTRKIYIEVMNAKADKVKGVDYLCKFLHHDKRKIYTFGDAENDILMLKGYNGIAPIDGCSEAKKVAKYIMKSASESGVYHFIKDILGE